MPSEEGADNAVEILPLVQLDYAVGTDRYGRADRRTELGITASTLTTAVNAGEVPPPRPEGRGILRLSGETELVHVR